MGRDPFEDANESPNSRSVEKLIRGKSPLVPDTRAVEVTLRLTPGALKHLASVRAKLAARGREVSEDELVRIAITLLSAEDVT